MNTELVNKILSLYPEYNKVYGPYKRKDGRQHVLLYNASNNKQLTVSYPKILMEAFLERRLVDDETVDHKDKDFTNNEIDNLRVINRSNHVKLDVKRRKPLEVECTICKKKFIATRHQLNKRATGFFCSKQCSGVYGKQIQLQQREKSPKMFKTEYYCNKDLNDKN